MIDNIDRILDGIDQIVGGSTRYTYGVRNRFYAKRRPADRRPGRPGPRDLHGRAAAELLHERAGRASRPAVLDEQQRRTARAHFSPILLTVRAHADRTTSMRARAPSSTAGIGSSGTISASGTYSWSTRLQTTVGWSKRAFIAELAGFNNPDFLDHSLNVSSTVHTRDNKYGGVYSFNYDVLRRTMIQQRMYGVLQRAVLRHRVRVPESRLFELFATAASSCRSRSPGSATSRRSTARSAACRADAVDERRGAVEQCCMLAIFAVESPSCRARYWSPGPQGSPAVTDRPSDRLKRL